MSLRQVEEATGKAVSNAYLSQLETGKITKPNPNILHALSELYAIRYEKLMEMAGYISTSSPPKGSQRRAKVGTFSEHNLSQEEEARLLEFLQFLRSRKPE
jgi:transcriptional regulator with XRE-family HTH domain